MSIRLYNEAKKHIVGGVNSPVRSFKIVNITPIYIKKANKKYIFDEDGNKYIDFCLSWGAIILGHNNRLISNEIKKAVNYGLSYGLCHKYEIELAKIIKDAFPSMEKVRFVNSGTEAAMSAIRVARAFTNRKKILKFEGCYHGHSDFFLVKSGSGVFEISESSSSGVPEEILSTTISIPFNNIEILNKVFHQYGKELACVIIEPVPANMGLIIPDYDFLSTLAKLCKEYNVVLIFDEVITGFRVCYGGAQHIFDIKPDLTILGKIIGGGLPIGCFGGKEEIMNQLAPIGNVYQAGTLSGNPLTMRVGIIVLNYLKKNLFLYSRMEDLLYIFGKEWRNKKIRNQLNIFYTIFSIFYTDKDIKNYEDAKKQDLNLFRKYYIELLNQKLFFPPSCYETCFLSTFHNYNDLEKILKIFSKN